MGDCLICSRIQAIKSRMNPYFIAELETGYVVSGDHQFFKGYTLFLCKQHVSELHMLEEKSRLKYLQEMSLVAESVFSVFKPKRLNYEALGNSEYHLHWHIFPRHEGDPNPKGPIWQIDKEIRCHDRYISTEGERKEHKSSILAFLRRLPDIEILSW